MGLKEIETNDIIHHFEDKRIRTAWDEEKGKMFFLCCGCVCILIGAPDYATGQKNWNKLKQSPKDKGSESVSL